VLDCWRACSLCVQGTLVALVSQRLEPISSPPPVPSKPNQPTHTHRAPKKGWTTCSTCEPDFPAAYLLPPQHPPLLLFLLVLRPVSLLLCPCPLPAECPLPSLSNSTSARSAHPPLSPLPVPTTARLSYRQSQRRAPSVRFLTSLANPYLLSIS
jgi:hypothetical protein